MTTAKLLKILSWTLGMAIAVFLMTDGKVTSEHPLQHLLIGALLGFVLGAVFSRRVGTKIAAS
jgi:hypothetical protein